MRALTVGFVLMAAVASAQVPVASDQSWCRENRGWGHHARACEVRETTLRPGQTLAVDASPNGGIEVVGWDRPEVRLQARVEASGDDQAEARQLLQAVRVATDGTIRATGPRPDHDDEWWSASFRLSVPRKSDVDLRSMNGGIDIKDVAGHIVFRTVNGGVSLAGLAGDVRGNTTNGGIDVDLDGRGWDGAGLDVETTNGGVTVRAADGYDAHLDVSTVHGRVHGLRQADEEERRGRHGWSGTQHIEADLGRGGAPIRLSTTNGGVEVETR